MINSENFYYTSVVVPTYKDWNTLALCIDALNKQSISKSEFEIIIVNNDPATVMPVNFSLPQNAIVIDEQKSGSYAARNAGITKAKGNILAFTDSDCIPDVSWLEHAINFFKKNGNYERIAGKVILFFKNDKPNLAELYENIFAFDQARFVKKQGAGVTANMFAYRKVFDSTGLFDDTLLSGGDVQWGKRAANNKFAIAYVADAVVKHPARHTIQQLINKKKRVAGGGALRKKFNFSNSIFNVIKSLKPPTGIMKQINASSIKLSGAQKMRIYFLWYYLSIVRSVEIVKVVSGKNPNR